VTNLSRIESELKEKGYKLTNARIEVLKVLIKNEGKHLTSQEIYEMVHQNTPGIGMATVYRTLSLLEEMRLLYSSVFTDGKVRYELAKDDNHHKHHHLVCLNCNKIIEVEEDLLEEIEKKIWEKKKFKIVDHSLKFYGYCKECYQKEKKD